MFNGYAYCFNEATMQPCNHWLPDWPERQVVQCNRDISVEDLQRQMKQVLQRVEVSAVTYTAAKIKGEERIARAVRKAGWLLVVLLLDVFSTCW